jgi:hypothetical protein
MRELAYRRHFLILSVAVPLLHLSWLALYWLPAGNMRFAAIFGLTGALHAASLVRSLERRATIARRVSFMALAAFLGFVAPLSGFVALPLLPVVPVIVRLVPQLRDIGDSTPGDSIRFLLVVLSASACGSTAYWFLVRAFWSRALRYPDLARTICLCVTATLLAFVGVALLGSTPAYFNSTSDVAAILPTVLWWFAFSSSLRLGEPSDEQDKPQVPEPVGAVQ